MLQHQKKNGVLEKATSTVREFHVVLITPSIEEIKRECVITQNRMEFGSFVIAEKVDFSRIPNGIGGVGTDSLIETERYLRTEDD